MWGDIIIGEDYSRSRDSWVSVFSGWIMVPFLHRSLSLPMNWLPGLGREDLRGGCQVLAEWVWRWSLFPAGCPPDRWGYTKVGHHSVQAVLPWPVFPWQPRFRASAGRQRGWPGAVRVGGRESTARSNRHAAVMTVAFSRSETGPLRRGWLGGSQLVHKGISQPESAGTCGYLPLTCLRWTSSSPWAVSQVCVHLFNASQAISGIIEHLLQGCPTHPFISALFLVSCSRWSMDLNGSMIPQGPFPSFHGKCIKGTPPVSSKFPCQSTPALIHPRIP